MTKKNITTPTPLSRVRLTDDHFQVSVRSVQLDIKLVHEGRILPLSGAPS